MTAHAATGAAAAAVLALLAARFGTDPALPAFAYLAVIGVVLAAIDLEQRRLPDKLTLPSYPALLLLFTAAAAATGSWAQLGRSVLAGAALAAAYLLLAVARPGQLGGGDVKLAGLLGMALGWLGWPQVLAGGCLGFVLAAAASLVLLAGGRVSLKTMIPFGPFMLWGALIAAMLRL